MDWFDLLAVQGTLKSLLQHHSSKASILRCSAFFTAQLSQHIKADITLPTKTYLVKPIDFPVVINMNGCEIRTIKNVEHRGEMLLNCGVGEDS